MMDKMTVTSAKYTSHDGANNDAVSATIDGQHYSVPIDADNRHYQAILDWVAMAIQ